MTNCSESYLFGESKKLTQKEGIADDFDLFIFTCGWELRCTEILNYLKNKISYISILSFLLNKEEGYPKSYMDSLINFSKKKNSHSILKHIEGEITDLKGITDQIEYYLYDIVKELKRPLKIGFDISSCPRYFFIYFLNLCIKYEIANEISFFYSEGKYEKEKEEFIYTKGEWNIISIPGFEGNFNPEGKLFYIVSAGFEGRKYRSVISKYEPQKLGILLPIPGFNDRYTKQVKEECGPLKKEFNVPSQNIVSASAGDAIEAWNVLKSKELNAEEDNIIYLTFGPKPHILGMGLHAISNDRISILYRMPQGYTRMNVKPTGKFWRYSIKNLSII